MGHLLVAFEEEAQRLARETDHPLLGPASLHAGTISGGSAPSVYPDRCDLVVERRTLPHETADSVMAEVERVLARARERRPGLKGRASAGLFRAATEVPGSSPLVTGLREACERSGVPGALKGMSAWVDACFLNEHGTPAVCFGPGSIAQAHASGGMGQRGRDRNVRTRPDRLRPAVPEGRVVSGFPAHGAGARDYLLRLLTMIAPPVKLVPNRIVASDAFMYSISWMSETEIERRAL